MHVCMYVCMYLCELARFCERVYICMQEIMKKRLKQKYTCMCITCIDPHIHAYVHTYKRTYIHTGQRGVHRKIMKKRMKPSSKKWCVCVYSVKIMCARLHALTNAVPVCVTLPKTCVCVCVCVWMIRLLHVPFVLATCEYNQDEWTKINITKTGQIRLNIMRTLENIISCLSRLTVFFWFGSTRTSISWTRCTNNTWTSNHGPGMYVCMRKTTNKTMYICTHTYMRSKLYTEQAILPQSHECMRVHE